MKPCGLPFADADADKDVDQDGFAIFQRCITGAGGTASFNPADCACFDRDVKDNDVDEFDLTAFEKCRTAPGCAGRRSLTELRTHHHRADRACW